MSRGQSSRMHQHWPTPSKKTPISQQSIQIYNSSTDRTMKLGSVYDLNVFRNILQAQPNECVLYSPPGTFQSEQDHLQGEPLGGEIFLLDWGCGSQMGDRVESRLRDTTVQHKTELQFGARGSGKPRKKTAPILDKRVWGDQKVLGKFEKAIPELHGNLYISYVQRLLPS